MVENPVLTSLLEILLAQPEPPQVSALLVSLGDEAQFATIGAPRGIEVGARIGTEVEGEHRSITSHQPHISIEILIEGGIGEPLAIGGPAKLYWCPAAVKEAEVASIEILHRQVAIAVQEGDLLTVGREAWRASPHLGPGEAFHLGGQAAVETRFTRFAAADGVEVLGATSTAHEQQFLPAG